MVYSRSQAQKKLLTDNSGRNRRRAFALAAATRSVPALQVRFETTWQTAGVWSAVGVAPVGKKAPASKTAHERRRAFAIAAAGRSTSIVAVRFPTGYPSAVNWRGVGIGLSAAGLFLPIATANQALASERQGSMQVGLTIVGSAANLHADSTSIPGTTLRLRAGYKLTSGAAAEIAARRETMTGRN